MQKEHPCKIVSPFENQQWRERVSSQLSIDGIKKLEEKKNDKKEKAEKEELYR